eukprot:sb/3474902/
MNNEFTCYWEKLKSVTFRSGLRVESLLLVTDSSVLALPNSWRLEVALPPGFCIKPPSWAVLLHPSLHPGSYLFTPPYYVLVPLHPSLLGPDSTPLPPGTPLSPGSCFYTPPSWFLILHPSLLVPDSTPPPGS